MALDRLLDGKATGLTKDQKKRFTSSQLSSAIDWAWSGSYDSPGAPPNGADYVLATSGRPMTGSTIDKMWFRGASTYTPDPVEWTVDKTARAGNPALYSGVGDELDRTVVYGVKVPTGKSTLTFDSKANIEQGWDFGVVQVSTDGGKTYTSLSNANTTSDHDPAAAGNIVAQLPGFTGLSDWSTQSFDLSAYAGKQVLVSFRYLTDAASNGNDDTTPGWWVDNVKVASTVVTNGANLKGARSATQISPIPVAGWSVQLVGWTLNGKKVAYQEVKLNKSNAFSLDRAALRAKFGKSDRIGVIVGVDDPNETATKYADYSLWVNGTKQPGGGQ